ncbi:beta-1,3-glucosyltransferase-like [Watersipora subatra]|uniref:beta-1,3-glucosyltransferase-like n=1 Tax=Watersipora subatra TaxID=2589382 RepID=UPI00355AD213
MGTSKVCSLLSLLRVSFLLMFICGGALATQRLLVVINNQDNPHHLSYSKLTQSYIQGQADSVKRHLAVEVIISTATWPDLRSLWTFYPLLKELKDLYESDNIDWVLVIQEHTEVDLVLLQKLITSFNSSAPQFIGRALQDKTPTIIHHYENTSLKYPDSSSGMLLSWPLITSRPNREPIDFNIDPQHELARYLYDDGKGTALTDAAEFCGESSQSDTCATRYSLESTLCPASSMHKAVSEDDIFVMIKTGEVYHKTRVPLQMRLWTGRLKHKEINSEKLDPSIPTVKVDAPNTERGHCAKFYAILKRALQTENIRKKPWLVIVDDDTIMNVTRLAKLLSCYSVKDKIALGERYGYKAHDGYGYSYITGGGGTVLSMPSVKAIINGGYKCNKPDEPDDMMLGIWLRSLQIPALHSSLFHQAPPSAYAPRYIVSQKHQAISFHKYQPDDPDKVAKEWLGLTPLLTPDMEHDEL